MIHHIKRKATAVYVLYDDNSHRLRYIFVFPLKVFPTFELSAHRSCKTSLLELYDENLNMQDAALHTSSNHDQF